MKKKMILQTGLLWVVGAVLFALRLIQLRTGFDPDTGLALPSLAGRILWIGLLVCIAVEAFLCVRRPKDEKEGKHSFACCFLPPEGPALYALAAGSILLAAGGGLLLVSALPPQGTAAVTAAAAGLLGIASGAGLLLLVKELRGGGTPTVFPLLPAMFFSVLFLLAVYFPEESSPVLERYYLPVLASGMAAYFLYQLAGFLRREGSLRWFGFTCGLTAVTCIAAAADGVSVPGRLLVFLGYALTATAFCLSQREEPLPEPEEPEEDEEAEEDEEQSA